MSTSFLVLFSVLVDVPDKKNVYIHVCFFSKFLSLFLPEDTKNWISLELVDRYDPDDIRMHLFLEK